MANASNTSAIPRSARIACEYSAFAIDGRPDVSMVVYNPTTREDLDKIRSLIAEAEPQ